MPVINIKASINNQIFNFNGSDNFTEILSENNIKFEDICDLPFKIYESSQNIHEYFVYTNIETVEDLLGFLDHIKNFDTLEDLWTDLDSDSQNNILEKLGIPTDWLPFDEESVNLLANSPFEAIRRFHFGNTNWNDDYIRLNNLNNFETTDELPTVDFTDQGHRKLILKTWLEDNY